MDVPLGNQGHPCFFKEIFTHTNKASKQSLPSKLAQFNMSKFKLWKRKNPCVYVTGRDLGVGFSAMIGGCRKGRFRTAGMSKILEGWAYVVGIICSPPSGIGLNNLSKYGEDHGPHVLICSGGHRLREQLCELSST